MTPKEKADEILKRMYAVHSDSASYITLYFAKKCALIAVDEMIIQNGELYLLGLANDYYTEKNTYLFDVKSELQMMIEEKKINNTKHELPVVFFLGIKVIRYRIVRDGYAGFECQKWRLWFPFWLQMGYANTHPSIDRAISYIKNDGTVVLSY